MLYLTRLARLDTQVDDLVNTVSVGHYTCLIKVVGCLTINSC